MIQHVESFEADLQVHVLGQPHHFLQREIDIEKSGTAQHIAPRIAEHRLGVGGCRKGRQIPPVEKGYDLPALGFRPCTREQLSTSSPALATAASLVLMQEAGNPLRTVAIPPTCQPPSTPFSTRLKCCPKRRPFPKGSS